MTQLQVTSQLMAEIQGLPVTECVTGAEQPQVAIGLCNADDDFSDPMWKLQVIISTERAEALSAALIAAVTEARKGSGN